MIICIKILRRKPFHEFSIQNYNRTFLSERHDTLVPMEVPLAHIFHGCGRHLLVEFENSDSPICHLEAPLLSFPQKVCSSRIRILLVSSWCSIVNKIPGNASASTKALSIRVYLTTQKTRIS